MDLTKQYNEKELTITVKGKIDTINAPDFENEIMDDTGKFDSLILNLNDLEYISSSGLRVLIAVEKKVPIAAAVPFSFMGIANHLTQAQVLEMYANGIEILSHTYSHMYTTEATEQEYERDYQKAKNSYSLIGIPCELLVYAGGSANAANAQEAAKRVYIGAFNSGKEHTNFSDKNDKYNLERYGITDSNDDGRIDGTDLDQLKALIDSVKQTGGWMVWMTHTSGEYWSETMCQNIADVIDYSLAQGVPVVTAAYGFRKYFGV